MPGAGEIPPPPSFSYLFGEAGLGVRALFWRVKDPWRSDPGRRHRQVGSLAGAAHLLKGNAGVLRGTHREQKSRVEQKGKSPLDFDFQCEYKP
jgi:hypothetical protein